MLAVLLGCHPALAQVEPGKPLPRPGGVMPEHDRRLSVDLAAWPWSSIGRVNIVTGPRRSHCTGTLVGERHVLTAAHCLYDQRVGRWVRPGQVHFVLGQNGDRHIVHATVAETIVPPGYDPSAEIAYRAPTQAAETRLHDWAILVLAERVAVRPVSWRVVKDLSALSREAEIMVAGYRADRPYRLSVEGGCKLGPGPAVGLVSHGCGSLPGVSGGPILAMRGGEAEIIAINASYFGAFVPGSGHVGYAAFGPLAAAFDRTLKQLLGR